ncbi:hypothetical protein, partial [Alistipes ihumii]|uniref:hypothetical protein n=1 Tax=Alistipes ihumii TaxID=1470347 RepID=UPI0026657764
TMGKTQLSDRRNTVFSIFFRGCKRPNLSTNGPAHAVPSRKDSIFSEEWHPKLEISVLSEKAAHSQNG